MKRFLITLVATAAMACGIGTSDDVYRYHYKIVIDPSFTPEEVQGMITATHSWENAVPVTFDFAVAVCTNPGFEQICVSPAPTSFTVTENVSGQVLDLDGVCYMDGSTDHIYMYPRSESFDALFFEQTFQHELGHAQGLVHHTGCYVMNPILTECAQTPTTNDVDQWFEVWRE